MNIKHIIDGVMSGMNQRNTAVTTILSDYRKDVAAATEESSYYKDEQGELSRRKAALIADARQRIATADQRFADTVKAAIPKLRKELSGYLCKPADPDLLRQLKTHKDFDIKMSRQELDAYIMQAAGNYTALRAIQKVAENSGFSVSIPDGFEKELEAVERMGRTPSMYCSSDYVAEAQDVLSDVPVFREDGSVGNTMGRPGTVYLILREAGSKSDMEKLESMAAKWSTSFVPEISELKPIQDPATGEIISPEEHHSRMLEDAADVIEVESPFKGLEGGKDNSRSILEHYV